MCFSANVYLCKARGEKVLLRGQAAVEVHTLPGKGGNVGDDQRVQHLPRVGVDLRGGGRGRMRGRDKEKRGLRKRTAHKESGGSREQRDRDM